MPDLLDHDVLAAFERALDAVGAAIAGWWAPGLTDAEIDALTAPHGFALPEEARRWWRWHDGLVAGAQAPSAYLTPRRAPASLAETLDFFAADRGARRDVWGVDHWLSPVADVPYIFFACGGPPDAPVPVHTQQDIDPRPALPSIGELVKTWTRLIETGVFTTDANGIWVDDFEKVPEDLRRLGVY